MNEIEKKKKLIEAQKDKEIAQQMMRDIELAEIQKEKKREEEKQAREEKIKKIMDRMGDVIAKSDEAEKAFDRQIIKDALQKDKEANMRDKQKAKAVFEREKELRRTLAE